MYKNLMLLLIIFIATIFVLKKEKKIDRYVRKIIFIILFLMAGFRNYNINEDSTFYKQVYESLPPLKELNFQKTYNFEKCFIILNSFLKSLNFDYQALFIVVSFVSITLYYVSFEKMLKNKYLGILVYLCWFYINNEFITIRSGVGIAIIFSGLKYLGKNNKKYVICVILGTLFHRSLILALLAIYVQKYLRNKQCLIIGIIITFVIGRFDIIRILFQTFPTIFPAKISYYLEYKNSSGSYFRLLVYIPIFLYFLKNYRKYLKYKLFESSYSFMYIAIIFTNLFITNREFVRIPYLFTISIIILQDIYLKEKMLTNKILINKFLIKIGIALFNIAMYLWTYRSAYF